MPVEQVIPLDDYIGYLHYYASRYKNKRFEHWELINEAWIKVHGLPHIEYMSQGIRWAMSIYKRIEYARDHHRNPDARVIDFSTATGGNEKDAAIKAMLIAVFDRHEQQIEDKDTISYLVYKAAKLPMKDRILIDMHYCRHMSYRSIAALYGCSYEWIRQRMLRILERLIDAAEGKGLTNEGRKQRSNDDRFSATRVYRY
jgi:RNA polymerase sigma factor (sigma-70 family)